MYRTAPLMLSSANQQKPGRGFSLLPASMAGLEARLWLHLSFPSPEAQGAGAITGLRQDSLRFVHEDPLSMS